MNPKGDKNRDRIDLGLSAILAGSADEKRADVSIDIDAGGRTSIPDPVWTLGGSRGTPKGEFDILADERKWEEILRRVEPRLSEKGDFEARLWWIRGHLGAFSMPVTFLAAPLESVCREIVGTEISEPLRALLKETGLLALCRLEEIGEKHQAACLRSALEPLGIHRPRGGERRRAGTSSFRSLENLAEAQPIAPQPMSESLGTKPLAEKRTHRVVWTTACLGLVLGIFLVDRVFPHMRAAKLEAASDSFMSEPHGVELSRPLPERREPGGRLGALFYSLERGESSSSSGSPLLSAGSATTTSAQGTTDRGSPAMDMGQGSGVERTEAPRTKERVNTQGPIESPDWRRSLDRIGPPQGRASRDDLRGGPPAAVLPGSSQRGFEDQRTYRVLAKTSVLSAPSYGGRVIGQLERGDRVLVEGKLGRWLRLRSKKGRGGYVIAADVEEVQELDHN